MSKAGEFLLWGVDRFLQGRISSDAFATVKGACVNAASLVSPLHPYVKKYLIDVDPKDPQAGLTPSELSVMFNGLVFRLIPTVRGLFHTAAARHAAGLRMESILQNIVDEVGGARTHATTSHQYYYYRSIEILAKSMGIQLPLNEITYPIAEAVLDLQSQNIRFSPVDNIEQDSNRLRDNFRNFYLEAKRRGMIIPHHFYYAKISLMKRALCYQRGLDPEDSHHYWFQYALEAIKYVPDNAQEYGRTMGGICIPAQTSIGAVEIYTEQSLNEALREISAGELVSHVAAHDAVAENYLGYVRSFWDARLAMKWSRMHIGKKGVEDGHAMEAIELAEEFIAGVVVGSGEGQMQRLADIFLRTAERGYIAANHNHLQSMVDKMAELRAQSGGAPIPPRKYKGLMAMCLP